MKINHILLLLFISINVFSQNFEKSPHLKLGKDKYFDRIIGEDKHGFYALRFNFKSSANALFLNQYNKHTLLKNRTIELGKYLIEDEVNRTIDGIKVGNKIITNWFILKNRFFIFSKSYDYNSRSAQLLVDVFSLQYGNKLESDVLFASTPTYNGYELYQKKFDVSLNADSTKFLVISHNSSVEQKQITTADLYMVDGYERVWSKELISEYNGSFVKTRAYQLDKKDNLYYAFVYKSDSIKKQFDRSGIAMFLYKQNSEKVIPLQLPDNITFYNVSASYFADNNQLIFGFNFKDLAESKSKNVGIMAAFISTTTNLLENFKVEYISDSLKNTIECMNHGESILKRDFSPLKIKHIGNDYYFYSFSELNTLKNLTLVRNSESIIVFKFSANSNIEWQKLIPRSTNYSYRTENFDPTITVVNTKDNKLHFTYIDSPENTTLMNDFSFTKYCNINRAETIVNANVIDMSIDKDGNLNRNILFTNSNIHIMLSEVNIVTEKGNVYRYKEDKEEGFMKLFLK